MKRLGKINWVLAGGLLLLSGSAGRPVVAQAASDEPAGVALVIVYDTSGSMLQKVRDQKGQMTPKNAIAARALSAVIDRLQVVASAQERASLPLHAGLLIFRGDRTDFAVRFGPFDPLPYRHWLKKQDKPQSGTPLGEAVRVAGQTVLQSKLPRKHVLVITDGINTQGPDPKMTMPKVQEAAARAGSHVSMHFVAFDVNAAEFNAVKKLGATVVGAADEKQLNSQLEFILEKKILLEDEDPPSVKPQTE